MSSPPGSDVIHATTISVDGRAAVIIGASGQGKSSLALQIIALGAVLISDDQTVLSVSDGVVMASPPQTIAGLIEARGVGLLHLPFEPAAPVALVIDLDREEPERLPHPHTHALALATLPCLWRAPGPHFAAAILLWLRHETGPAQ